MNKDDVEIQIKVAKLEQRVEHLVTWIRIVAGAAAAGSSPTVLKFLAGVIT